MKKSELRIKNLIETLKKKYQEENLYNLLDDWLFLRSGTSIALDLYDFNLESAKKYIKYKNDLFITIAGDGGDPIPLEYLSHDENEDIAKDLYVKFCLNREPKEFLHHNLLGNGIIWQLIN